MRRLIKASGIVALLIGFVAISPLRARPVEDVGWDFSDPVNQAETREWCRRLYVAQDTGDVAGAFADFKFTNSPPALRETLVNPALDLFRKIYAHRINITLDPATCYDVMDLVRDDVAVRDQFRKYTTEGVLTTSADTDGAAFVNHLNAISLAMAGDSEYLLSGSVGVVGDALESTELSVVKEPPTTTPPTTTPPGGPLKDFIKCLVDQSLLQCMSDGGLYWPDDAHKKDYPTTRPDFDCDDFARAMLAWLRNRLRFDYGIVYSYTYLGISWECGVRQPDGTYKWVSHSHALAVIYVDNPPPRQMYVVDPQSGKVMGPYTPGTQSEDEIIKKILEELRDSYSTCPDGPRIIDRPYLKAPGWDTDGRDGGENPAWWHDRDLDPLDPRKNNPDTDMWKRFKDKLEACCREHPPAACGTGPGSTYSPCTNPDKYIWN